MNLWIGLVVIPLYFLCYTLAYQDGRRKGKEEGYRLGKIDADNWWLESEKQVDQARQKIWREHT